MPSNRQWRRRPIINASPRSLEYDSSSGLVRIIDQTRLPSTLVVRDLESLDDFCEAIASMQVRGAPLIGITAAYGLAMVARDTPDRESLLEAASMLASTRPTAVNLQWALQRMNHCLLDVLQEERATRALQEAQAIAEEDVASCLSIAEQGMALLESLAQQRSGQPVNILTHCNAGRLAALEWGTALAPIYLAQQRGLPVHVWVSETRPRNQGVALTAWELDQAGVPFTVIADNAAGSLMQQGRVDCCIVGSDRTAANGDVCNKIGTYLKALSAKANGIPFYVALPLSTVDWDCPDGSAIPIEERAAEEVLTLPGEAGGQPRLLSIASAGAYNPAFDITPSSLVTCLITEAGVVPASAEGLATLRPLSALPQ